MELNGKKINFLGDSITEGCCATRPEWGFVDVMKAKYAMAAARNYGIAVEVLSAFTGAPGTMVGDSESL